MLDQQLDPAKRGRPLPHPHPGGGCDRRLGAAADADRQHAPKAALHLAARDLVARVVRKSGIEHGGDRRVIGEAVRQLHRVRRRRAHPHVEGAQTPDQEERLERMQDHSVRLANFSRPRAKGVVAREAERARQNVGMPVEIFGRRVHDHVGAERDRPREDGRRAGGIHSEDGARRMSRARRAFDVAHAPQRIARRLEPYELRRSRLQRRGKRLQILGVNEIDAEPEGRRLVGEPGAERPIHALGRDDMRARSEAQEKRDRRRHARAQDERSGRAFERPDNRLRLAHGLVVGAAVGIAAAVKIVGIALEGRGEMDRRHDRAGALVDRPQRLGGEGARA